MYLPRDEKSKSYKEFQYYLTELTKETEEYILKFNTDWSLDHYLMYLRSVIINSGVQHIYYKDTVYLNTKERVTKPMTTLTKATVRLKVYKMIEQFIKEYKELAVVSTDNPNIFTTEAENKAYRKAIKIVRLEHIKCNLINKYNFTGEELETIKKKLSV